MGSHVDQPPGRAADRAARSRRDSGAGGLVRPFAGARAGASAACLALVLAPALATLGAVIVGPVAAQGLADAPEQPSEEESAEGLGNDGNERAAAARRVRDAQIRWFIRLLSERDMAPDVRRLLIEDFAAQSEATRRHLIRRYRAGEG